MKHDGDPSQCVSSLLSFYLVPIKAVLAEAAESKRLTSNGEMNPLFFFSFCVEFHFIIIFCTMVKKDSISH